MNEQRRQAQRSDLDDAEPPPDVPNFQVFYCIGNGGFGRVWLARDVIGQWRAIKAVYRSRFNDDEQGKRNYLRELGAVRRYAPVSMRYENLLKILYVGPENPIEYFYYVMDLADAEDGVQPLDQRGYKPLTLQSLVRAKERLPARQCLGIGLGLVTALDKLHGSKLLHRDIKPSNVIFVDGQPKLADIGLVEVLGEATSRVGTEGYIPPEGPGQETADVFALGRVLYVASTGHEPGKFPEAPSSVWSEGGDADWLELSEVLLKACQPDPTRRYQTAAAMRQDLLLLEARESLVRRNRWQRHRALLKTWGRWVIPATAGVAAVLTCGALRTAWQRQKIEEAKDSRQELHQDGWGERHSILLWRARKFGTSSELLAEAAAGLEGLDMNLKGVLRGFAASSIAFGPNGGVLFGGSAETNAHLYLPGENRFGPLPQKSAGPVAFDGADRLVQFVHLGMNLFALRDLQTGECRKSFLLQDSLATEQDCAQVLALAGDLSKAAAAVRSERGGCVVVWDVASGKELTATNELVTAMTFSPDGKCLALGMDDGRVTILEFPKLTRLVLPAERPAAVHALAFGPNATMGNSRALGQSSQLLAVGDSAATIRIYSIPPGTLFSRCRGSAYDVSALAFRSDGALLASGGREAVWLWEVSSGQPLLRTKWHLDDVRALAFSPDGSRLAVASMGLGGNATPMATVWDLQEGRGIQTLYGLGSRAELLWWAPDSHRIAALGQNWDLGIWSMPDGMLTQIIPLRPGGSQDNAAAQFNENGKWLAVAAAKEISLYDLDARTPLNTWSVPMGFSDSLRFEGTNRLFFLHRELDIAPGVKSAWVLRDLLTTNWKVPLLEQKDFGWVAYGTALPKNANYILVCGGPTSGNGSSVKAVSIVTGSEKWELKGSCPYRNSTVTLDPGGRLLAWRLSPEKTALYDLPDGRLRKELVVDGNTVSAIGPFVKWVARQDEPGWYLYSPSEPKRGIRLGIDSRAVGRAEFSPDGKMLAMPTAEGKILVADLNAVHWRLRELGWNPR